MVRIDTLIVVGLVTGHAGVRQVVIITLVTGIAVHGCMLTCKRPYRTMIECGGYPGILVVTINTGSGELLLQVIRIYCLIVIVGMASRTRCRWIVVIALVTVIATHARMCPHDRIERVIEGGGNPGCLIVTFRTIGRKLLCNVIRIGCLRVIVVMTTIAGIRRIVIVAVVTCCAVVGNGCMRSD